MKQLVLNFNQLVLRRKKNLMKKVNRILLFKIVGKLIQKKIRNKNKLNNKVSFKI